jgi:glycine/D-amino acid oxidase-like deaminating enzyme
VVLENEPAVGISLTDGRTAGVETAQRSIAAPVAVDAADGWVRQVAELAGARVPVATVRHQLRPLLRPDHGTGTGGVTGLRLILSPAD